MAICYSYRRFSSRKQASGDSLRRQEALLTAWLARNTHHTLDSQLTDSAISGFRGKNAQQGALGDFLRAIEAGKIADGSVLVIESIDRLTRLPVDDSYQLVRSILKKNIAIQTLQPERTIEKADLNDIAKIMEILIYASRANEESETKSMRGVAKWSVRREAAMNGKPMGRYCPCWITIKDGTFTIIEWKADVVRHIFALAIQGYGLRLILKTLCEEKVKHIGNKKTSGIWRMSFIAKILDNRATIGEYQPHTNRGAGRVAVGEALPNYYPAIITPETFYQAQAARQHRKFTRTRQRSEKVINLFAGLLFTTDGMRWVVRSKNPNGDYRLCCDAKPSPSPTVSYNLIERLILTAIPDVQPIDHHNETTDTQLSAVKAELAIVGSRLADRQRRLEDEDATEVVDELLVAIAKQKQQRTTLEQRLNELEMIKATEQLNPLGQLKHLRGQLLDNSTESRLQLRAAIAAAVEKIVVEPRKVGRLSEATVSVKYRGYPLTISTTTERLKELAKVTQEAKRRGIEKEEARKRLKERTMASAIG